MYAYLHPACGRPAFMLTQHPGYGGKATSSAGLHLNYRPVEYGSPMLCDSCGQSIGTPQSANIRTMI